MHKEEIICGVDIGGTNTVFGFINSEHEIIRENTIPTLASESVDKFVERLVSKIKISFSDFNDQYILRGIGIAAPGANQERGTIDDASNLSWGNVHFIDIIKQNLDVPVKLINDANAAALGEKILGVAKDIQNFVLLTLGTGVGSGIVINGKVLLGEHGMAGEFGHVVIVPDGRKCNCGRRGCLETYVSATGIIRTAYNLMSKYNLNSKIKDISFNDLTSKKLCDLAAENDPIAVKAFEYTGKLIGEKLADIVAIFNPEAIILTGGLLDAGELIMNPTALNFEKNLLNMYKDKVKIYKSSFNNGEGALLGASGLFFEYN